jgi:hypothetical protein
MALSIRLSRRETIALRKDPTPGNTSVSASSMTAGSLLTDALHPM